MKKTILLTASVFAFAALTSNTSSAQGIAHKFSFGLNVGAGIPMGAYSKSDTTALPLSQATVNRGKGNDTTKYNGFAKTSFHIDVYGTYMFSSNVGAMLSLGWTMNSYNITAFNTDVVDLLAKGGSSSTAPAFTSSGSYLIQQYMVGPYFAFPLGGDKLKLELKGLVGIDMANYPTLSYSLSSGGYSETASWAVKSGSGFGYKIGAGLKYMVAGTIGLHLDVAYAGSSISYSSSSQSQTDTFGGTTQSSSTTDPVSKTMSMSLLQITVGASIDL